MLDIQDRYIDVDMQREEKYVYGDMGVRKDGTFRDYASANSLMTWNEIDAEIEKMDAEDNGLEYLITRIFDQGPEGSCTCNATGQGNEVLQALQFGKENVVHVSAISLYKQVGRSAQSGAMCDDAVEQSAAIGFLPLDNEANRAKFGSAVMPNTGFGRSYPVPDWKRTAKKLATNEFFITQSTQALFTALCRRQPAVIGREGHSILYCRPKRQVVRGRMQRGIIYPNSWGNWGFGCGNFTYGFGFDTETQVGKSATYALIMCNVVAAKFRRGA